MSTRPLMVVTACLLALLVIPQVQNGSAEEPVGISIMGPPAVGTARNVTYTVNVSGGPAAEAGENGTYSIKAWLLGENIESAKPLASSPFEGNSTNGTFEVNITAPDHTGIITLIVEATSRGENESQSQAKKELDIAVVNPITIEVEVVNRGQVTARNITLSFYLDGGFIGNRSIDELPANNRTNITFEYAPPSLPPGRHVIRVVLDPGRYLVEFDEGNNVLEREFFVHVPEPDVVPFLIVVVVVASLGAVLIFYWAGRKKEKLRET